jgi:uncharacterized paraquat-inducible protein A
MAIEGQWIRVEADCRGYTNTFKCSECGSIVALNAFSKWCEYPYCPWCMAEMVDTDEEEAFRSDE